MKKHLFNIVLGAVIVIVAALIGWRYHQYLRYRETVKEELAKPDTITEKFGKGLAAPVDTPPPRSVAAQGAAGDRKSTRLNSSHRL